ncbi:short chain dehydrogenase [Cupriavidus sp. 30B13]|uniref:short chain dehydrogenase n=1 Tax=Cupriavidus sp. 30B13 TaxID=3384241 RepID=UPI003B90B60C
MKKIVVIGASGTLGKAVVDNLAGRHEVIRVGKTHGEFQVDITIPESVQALFGRLGKVDGIISTTGQMFFGPVTQMRAEDFAIGLNDKLLGQVRLALVGQHYLNDGGSITLTSGILSDQPIHAGANASSVNAALDGFVRAAAVELGRGLRINAVSPTVVQESWGAYGPFFPGFEAVSAARVALAYQRSVEGPQTGQVYRVW